MNIQDKAPTFTLPALDGKEFDASVLAGRPYMLAFMRFGACPFCNLRVRELIKYSEQLDQPFQIVVVYDSPLENIQQLNTRSESPLPILADGDSAVHKLYGVRYSRLSVILSMMANFPKVVANMMKGGDGGATEGPTNGMPAEFLVDSDGVIRDAWYGKGLTDRMPLTRIDTFISEYSGDLALGV